MVFLTSEIDSQEQQLAPVDLGHSTVKTAIEMADRGNWGFSLQLPGGRRMSVREFVRQNNLMRYLDVEALEKEEGIQ